MKKISKWTRFSFIILMFLFVSFTSAAQADNLLKAASPNPAFVTWQKNAQPSANNGSPAANYGYAPSPVNWRHLDNVTYGINGRASFTKQSKAALPAVYDLRGKMPSVRNQNPFGNCWTHSAMAATESNLITKGGGEIRRRLSFRVVSDILRLQIHPGRAIFHLYFAGLLQCRRRRLAGCGLACARHRLCN